MRKKIIFVIVILVIVSAIYGIAYTYSFPTIKLQNQMRNFCEENDFNGNFGQCRCFIDCKSLEKEYFRFDSGGLGSPECWCKLNNTSEQIW